MSGFFKTAGKIIFLVLILESALRIDKTMALCIAILLGAAVVADEIRAAAKLLIPLITPQGLVTPADIRAREYPQEDAPDTQQCEACQSRHPIEDMQHDGECWFCPACMTRAHKQISDRVHQLISATNAYGENGYGCTRCPGFWTEKPMPPDQSFKPQGAE
jgi:hypothetical protein